MHQIGVGFMRFFIYSRKSKFTGKGESVENQIQLCKEYIERMFGSLDKHEIMVFEDEGFSGKNLARPQFQRMLSLVHQKKADYVRSFPLLTVSTDYLRTTKLTKKNLRTQTAPLFLRNLCR